MQAADHPYHMLPAILHSPLPPPYHMAAVVPYVSLPTRLTATGPIEKAVVCQESVGHELDSFGLVKHWSGIV